MPIHGVQERVEGLHRIRPELRRIMAAGRLDENMEPAGRNQSNFEANLGVLRNFLPAETVEEYLVESINLI